jgi:hypothetical protein
VKTAVGTSPPPCRCRPDLLDRETALRKAKEFASAERDKLKKLKTPIK